MGRFIWPTVHNTNHLTNGRLHLTYSTQHKSFIHGRLYLAYSTQHKSTNHLTNGRLHLTYSTQPKRLPLLISLILSGTFLASRCCCCCCWCCCCCCCWSGSGVEGACHISCTHPGCSLSIHMYVLTQGLTDRTKNLLPLFLYTWRTPDFDAGVKGTVEWYFTFNGYKVLNNSFCFNSSFVAFSGIRRFSTLADVSRRCISICDYEECLKFWTHLKLYLLIRLNASRN